MKCKAMTANKLPASVQFFDNLSTITEMLERRFSLRRIWQALKDDDKYSGDYTHFCRLVKKEFPYELEKKRQPTPKPKPKVVANAPQKQEEQSSDIHSDEEDLEDSDGPLMFMDDIGASKK